MPASNPTLVVHHSEPMRHEIQLVPLNEPKDGELLLRIEKFGLTANNVTYAALGKALRYFDFFPAGGPSSGPWSALPVWGLATVLASRVPDVPEGARVYGYFPAASQVTLSVAASTPTGFRVDRPTLPPEHALYGQYFLLDRDPFYVAAKEDLMVVMRPLFLTGLLLADYLSVSGRLGDALLISSAASKTSYGLACALRAAGAAKVIGLASTGSQSAARAQGVCDPVLGYEELARLDASLTSTYVDVAGSQPVREALTQQLGGSLRGIVSVGLTHWRDGGYGGQGKTGVPTETFFAPGWGAKRQKEGGAAFFAQLRAGWLLQLESAERHFRIVQKSGAEALVESFAALVQGRANPEQALLHSL